jgi:hypothetical protein
MITIPEMKEMPDNCHECLLCYLDHDCIVRCPWFNCMVDNWGGKEHRLHDCPLVESEE